MGVGGQRHVPAALPPRKTRYPLYKRLGGPLGQFGRVRKISPPPGFDPRTVQPVASLYTAYAIPTHFTYEYIYMCVCVCVCVRERETCNKTTLMYTVRHTTNRSFHLSLFRIPDLVFLNSHKNPLPAIAWIWTESSPNVVQANYPFDSTFLM